MASLDEQFQIANQILQDAKRAESDNVRTEKRYLRYERIAMPLARNEGVRFRDARELRNWKKERFESLKHSNGGKKHFCQVDLCSGFVSVAAGSPVYDPRTGNTCRATGLVFVCRDTLVAHICGKDVCDQAVVQRQGILACPISGLELGQQYAHTYGVVWDYGQRGKRRGGDGGGGKPDVPIVPTSSSSASKRCAAADDDGYELIDEEEEGGEEDNVSQADDDPGRGGDDRRLSRFAKRPRTTTTSSLEPPPPPPPPTPTLVDRFLASRPQPLKPLYRFFRNSYADEMAHSTQRRDITYGQELIEWVFQHADKREHKTANELCNAMLFHPAAKKLSEDIQREALLLAEQHCISYLQLCTRHRMQADWLVMWNLFQQHVVTPFLVPSVTQFLSVNRGADLGAREYFSKALWRIWKIVESSPYCCSEHLEFGDATAKKKRSHIHLKHIAVAIFYAMKIGVRKDIWFNKRTRKVYMLESEAKQDQEACAEEVCFVQVHQYLKRRLPPEDRFKNLPFEQISGTGTVTTTVVDTYRWITRCYDSLLALTPPLTIDQVREYELSRYMACYDEDLQGRFAPVK